MGFLQIIQGLQARCLPSSMARTHHHHSAFHLKNRLADPMALDHSQEISAVELLHVSKRRSLESSSNKCTKNDKSALCGKPSETNNVTLPIVLGIVYEFRSNWFLNRS